MHFQRLAGLECQRIPFLEFLASLRHVYSVSWVFPKGDIYDERSVFIGREEFVVERHAVITSHCHRKKERKAKRLSRTFSPWVSRGAVHVSSISRCLLKALLCSSRSSWAECLGYWAVLQKTLVH